MAMRRVSILLVAVLLSLMAYRAAAHDIPSEVTVQAFVKPQGERLHLLVRVPLKAMRDTEFPLRGPGYLDLARVNTLVSDAATLWISDFIELYENDTRLEKPQVIATRVSLPSDKS